MGGHDGFRHRYSLKTRLYIIFALLALLPLCGVVITLVGGQRMVQDDATLQHAAAGTIHLERINGLVYAATMEAGGIYMSPNWDTAKRFAGNLTADLGELRQLLTVWQQDAKALGEANIRELSQRVEDFIRFHTEMIRLAKEQDPAAARTIGDNETNRAVRASLNQSLVLLSRAYEQNLQREQATVAEGDREFVIGLAALSAIAGIALCCGFVWMRDSLVRPFLALKDRMLQLASGNLDRAAGSKEPAAEIAEMTEAVEQFRLRLIERHRLSRENAMLSSFNQWLQSCNSLDELNVRLCDQLYDQSIRDPLTGLYNRRSMLEACSREFARAAREGLSVGVLSIDVDHFKKYNDEHGNDAGDTVLRAVGRILNTLFRSEDVPCRVGGEEFVVLLPGADAAATEQRAEQLRSHIEAMVVHYLEQDLPHVTVSIGIATFPEAGSSPETVLRAAEEALYRAKAAGQNRVENGRLRDVAPSPPSASPVRIDGESQEVSLDRQTMA